MRPLRRSGIQWTILVLSVLAPPLARAAEPTDPSQDAKGQWVEIKTYWGYRTALAMDRQTGNLFAARWRDGGIVMSTDLGRTFTRVDKQAADGNPFSAHALFAAAEGGKIAAFCSQRDKLSGHSLDGGKTWTSWTKVGTHGLDYGVVDWASGAIFAMPHEEYRAYFSPDWGRTWTQLELKYPGGTNKPHEAGGFKFFQSGMGIFSATELVYCHDFTTGIQRSDDAGKTWAKVSDHFCQGPVQLLAGVGYWLAKKEQAGKWSGILLSTRDKGKTWDPVGKPIDNGQTPCMTTPRFGKSDRHILVAAAAGIVESLDGGQTWKLAARYADTMKLNATTVDTNDCFEYDPVHDVFYLFCLNEAYGTCRTWVYRR